MDKLASKLIDTIKDFAEENPDLVKTLGAAAAAGGIGAGAGALLTGDREDESPSDKAKRRLKNALLTGGLAAGGVGLLSSGYDAINTALPEDARSPLGDLLHSNLVRAGGIFGGWKLGDMLKTRGDQAAINSALEMADKKLLPKDLSKDSIAKLMEELGSKHPKKITENAREFSKQFGSDKKKILDFARGVGIPLEGLSEQAKRYFGISGSPLADSLKTVNKIPKIDAISKSVTKIPGMKDVHLQTSLAKLLEAGKRNKKALGFAAAGALLPEVLGIGSDAVSDAAATMVY